jgi:hypothetical protein
MTQFDYTRNIPEQTHNPSIDAPLMKINTNKIDELLAVNHNSFNVPNGGTHTKVELQNFVSIPTGLLSGFGTIYTKIVSGLTQLFFTRDTSGVEIQLTGSNLVANQGYTFLPGGIILQWGSGNVNASGSATTFTFPKPFISSVFSITLGCQINQANNAPAANNYFINQATPVTLTQFTVCNSSSSVRFLSYMVIGI